MKRALVLALAAACGTPARHARPPAPAPTPAPAPVPAATGAPVVRADPALGGTEAPTAGAIQLVAATPDGGAAITADELHEVRLWPALDGSLEPRIVELPEPRELALGRRGDGFTAAVLDAAGGLYLAHVDAHGRSRSHVSLPAEPACEAIAMSTDGLVAWRADQTIALYDGDGATLGSLATRPGERIVTVAVGGAHVAALLERGGKRGVRSAVLVGTPAWGEWIELPGSAPDLLAVAPSGRLAARQGTDVVVLEPSGKSVGKIADVVSEAFAFVDDTNLVVAAGGALTWRALGEAAGKPRDVASGTVVAGGGHAISAAGGDLVIATATDAKYLGYEVESPSLAEPAGDGQLVIGTGSKFFALDRRLRVVGSPSLPVPFAVSDLRWLGGDAWVVETTEPGNDHTLLRLVEGGTSSAVRKDLRVAHVLAYEPSTHLVTLSLGEAPSVYRYDPDKHQLAPVAALDGSNDYIQTELIPVAPARAGGTQLLRVTLRDATTIEWLRDAGKLGASSAKVTFAGSLAAADSAGHAYGWVQTPSGLELAVFRDGKRLGTLPADDPVSLWPDPAGTRVVAIATHAVTLITSDGQRVWTKPLEHATEALWLSDDALALITAAGIARVDPATGAVTAARCGWGFGLSATPHPPASRVEPVCGQLEGPD